MMSAQVDPHTLFTDLCMFSTQTKIQIKHLTSSDLIPMALNAKAHAQLSHG